LTGHRPSASSIWYQPATNRTPGARSEWKGTGFDAHAVVAEGNASAVVDATDMRQLAERHAHQAGPSEFDRQSSKLGEQGRHGAPQCFEGRHGIFLAKRAAPAEHETAVDFAEPLHHAPRVSE
jgi:hypothetical protein